MPSDLDEQEPDRAPGAPHPREQLVLFGHEPAEQVFLDGIAAGRLHHAWLIGGPEGIGKATLAYRVARYLLARERSRAADGTLAVAADDPAVRQVVARSHPNLAVLRRAPATDKKGPAATIAVDAVRRAMTLFGSTAADGGYRVCIVDSADDLTTASANALLKLIEEPPPRSIFLLVSHAPQRLLPTIRSRCRKLVLRPLAESDLRVALASLGTATAAAEPGLVDQAVALAEGSVRRALEMLDADRIRLVRDLSASLQALPRVDPKYVLALAESLARKSAEDDYALALDTVLRFVADRLETQAGLGAARLAPLVEVWDKVARSAQEVEIYNLDRRPLFLSLFDDLAQAVRRAG